MSLLTRMELELEIMRMLNQGVGGASILSHDAFQRQRIAELEALLTAQRAAVLEEAAQIALL